MKNTINSFLKFFVCGLLLVLSGEAPGVMMEAAPGNFCVSCMNEDSGKLPIELIAGKKKKKKKKSRRAKNATKSCPAGIGPMNTHRCPKSQEKIIAKVLGAKHVACYSKLFFVESGCKVNKYHDKKKAHNPNVGFGLCALETDPSLRAGRGKNCTNKNIKKSYEIQTKCCADIMRNTNARYFGTVKCKKTPRCY